MSYTNVEILSGVLVVACVMLLWCQRSKPDSMHSGYAQDGIKLREGYSALPMYGRFTKEGYVTGRPHDGSLSYTTRSSYFSENAEDKGLNELQTKATPASENCRAPENDVNISRWFPDANITSYDFSSNEELEMYRNVFDRQNNRVKEAGETLSGATMAYVDYGANMVPTRQVTM